MTSSVTISPHRDRKPFTQMQSVGLVFCCTLIGAVAQIFMKTGVNQIQHLDPLRIVTNLPLLAGYSLYGINTLLLMLALRDGELSVLYPIIALSYVWVTILSVIIFKDSLNVWRVAGIALIIGGVIILGRAAKT